MKDNTLREILNRNLYADSEDEEHAIKVLENDIETLLAEEVRKARKSILNEVIHQSTINLKSAKAVSQWAEIRIKQLEKEGK